MADKVTIKAGIIGATGYAGVELFRIGTTIGAHTVVGTVALFFMGDERTE